MPFNAPAFGIAARALQRQADALSREVHLALVYARDTAAEAGQGDFDLLHAAQCLELAARDARLLHAKIQQMRHDQTNPAFVE